MAPQFLDRVMVAVLKGVVPKVAGLAPSRVMALKGHETKAFAPMLVTPQCISMPPLEESHVSSDRGFPELAKLQALGLQTAKRIRFLAPFGSVAPEAQLEPEPRLSVVQPARLVPTA